MMRISPLAACFLLLLSLTGCSNRPVGVSIPHWDASGLASAVLEKLDKNVDAQVDQKELSDSPGLAFGARFIDENGDQKLSRDELEARFAQYGKRRIGLTPKGFLITYNGQPLAAAQVRLVPEFFLTDVIEPATGTTMREGTVYPSVSGQATPLVRLGYYRVEVNSDGVKLPAKFNTATTVGVEVSPFDGEPAAAGIIEIPLRDKK